MSKRDGKIVWLDNLRVIAIFFILSFHFWIFFHDQTKTIGELTSSVGRVFAIPFQLGWEADNLFFVISGIGLAMSAMRHQRSWAAFFVARAKRIYIPYWISVIVLFFFQGMASATGSWLKTAPGPYTVRDIVFNTLLVPANNLNLFSSHYWFLYTLIELYVLFPAIFWIIRRFRWAGIAGITVLHIVFSLAPPRSLGIFTQASSVGYWGEAFCIGVFVGVLLVESREKLETLLFRLLPVGAIALVIGSMSLFYPSLKPYQYVLLSVGMLIVGYAFSRIPVHLEYLGKISFGAYLIHMQFIGSYRFVFGFVEQPSLPIYLFYMITTVAMGIVLTKIADVLTDALARPRAAAPAI